MAVQFFANQLKYTGKGPLDPKALVKTYADLLSVDTWTANGTFCAYNGMVVSVWLDKDNPENDGVYYLFDPAVTKPIQKPDVTNSNYWHKISTLEDVAKFQSQIDALEATIYGVEASEGTEYQAGLVEKVSLNEQAIADIIKPESGAIATAINAEIIARDAAIKIVADKLGEIPENSTVATMLGEINESLSGKVNSGDVYLKTETYSKDQIDQVLANISHFTTKVINDISEATEPNVLYLIKDAYATGKDIYNEYIVFEGLGPTLIGDTSTDLTNYVDNDHLATILQDYAKTGDVVTVNDFNAFKETNTQAINKARTDAVAEIIQIGYALESSVATRLETKADIITTADYRDAINAEIWGDSAKEWTTRTTDEAGKVTISYNPQYSNLSRVDILENKIGKEAIGVPGQEGYQAATGLFLKVDNAQAKADTVANDLATVVTSGQVAINKNDIATITKIVSGENAEDKTSHAYRITALEDTVADVNAKIITSGEIVRGNADSVVIADHKVTITLDAYTKQQVDQAIASATESNTAKLADIEEGTTVKAYIDNALDNIPEYVLDTATEEKLGGVKSATGDNKVTVANDGVMSVNKINVNSLTQSIGDVLILDGGNTF